MDREKVKYDIERCICHVPDACRDCSHYKHGEYLDCMEELLKDALALLKEQEAEPLSHMTDDSDLYFTCGKCGHVIWSEGYKFCPMCATRIAWNGERR